MKPALYLSIESDPACQAVIANEWLDSIDLDKIELVTESLLARLLKTKPGLQRGLVIGGPPCQGFSSLNVNRRSFQDPRSDGISQFVALFKK